MTGPLCPTRVVVVVELVVVEVVVELVVVVVGGRVVVVLDGRQMPLVPAFCCLHTFTKLWQVARSAACILRQALFSALVPVQSPFFGTSARQFAISCLQSLRQWLGFAATPPASIRTAPTVATASQRAR